MYYVYTYTDPSNGEIFYVGKGQAYRHKEHLNRSHNEGMRDRLLSMRQKDIEPVIDKVFTSPDEELVLELEEFLIGEIGRRIDGGTLYNIQTQARGCSRVSIPDEVVKLLGEYPDIVVGEMTGYNWCTLKDKRVALGIPSFKQKYKGTLKLSARFMDDTVLTIYDSNGNTYTGTKQSLCSELGICRVTFGYMLSGRYKGAMGYSLTDISNTFNRYTKFLFKYGEDLFEGTHIEFADRYNLNKTTVCNVIAGRSRTRQGWTFEKVKGGFHYEF